MYGKITKTDSQKLKIKYLLIKLKRNFMLTTIDIQNITQALQGTFATKDDLKLFATKDDLKSFATKDDLRRLPST